MAKKTFIVTLCRSQTTQIEVKAANDEEAKERAWALVDDVEENDWEPEEMDIEYVEEADA